ncbi:hypothetical protein Tco_1157135 [Tanacetum coccineum]
MTQRLTLKLEAWLCRYATLHAIYNLGFFTRPMEHTDAPVSDPLQEKVEQVTEFSRETNVARERCGDDEIADDEDGGEDEEDEEDGDS